MAKQQATTNKGGKVEQPTSVKARLAQMMLNGQSGTIDQLTSKLKSKAVTVRTSLSDLRSKKYGIGGKALNIVNTDGVYALANGATKKAAAPAKKKAKAKKS